MSLHMYSSHLREVYWYESNAHRCGVFYSGCYSVYGFTGADKGALPDKDISSAVTGFGRDMIAHTKKRVEQEYCKANGKKYDAVVIYG